jgi:hypothetical protein
MDIDERLRRLDRATFDAVVRRIVGDDAVMLASWRCDPIAAPVTSGFTAGIYRLRGTARARGGERPWSAVLKLIRRPAGTDVYDDPAGDLYWRREACAYESGLLDDLPGGLAAPRCRAVMAQPDGAVLLWLEDVDDPYDGRWPLAAFDAAARRDRRR